MLDAFPSILNNGFIAAVGLILVVNYLHGQFHHLRILSVSLVAAMIVGAYSVKVAGALFAPTPIWGAMLFAVLGGAVIGLVGGSTHSFIGKNHKALGLLASFGLLKVVQGGITVITGGGVEVFPLEIRTPLPLGWPLAQPTWLLAGLVFMIASLLIHWYVLNRTWTGFAATAIGDDRALASLFGINILRVELIVQIIGGALAGIAGVFVAIDSGLRPDVGFLIVLKAFGILIVSRGNFSLFVLWSLSLCLIEQIVGYFWGGQLKEMIGPVFLATVLLSHVTLVQLKHYLLYKRVSSPEDVKRAK